jgi:3-hydroxymyristoyl/3-hydroxydecanoyl-(acyl carrier protein) dehydratase/malonyl CoA-acyl carrier protein transacylase
LAVLAGTPGLLCRGLEHIVTTLTQDQDFADAAKDEPELLVIPPDPDLGESAGIAFVYPGLGNTFAGMGAGLSTLFPGVSRGLDARLELMRDQFLPELWWRPEIPREFKDHRAAILGQVSVASLASEVFKCLGVYPTAAIGYSMGESAALVALGVWSDRDELTRDFSRSPLFSTELAGPCHAARRVWGLNDTEAADWVAGIVPRPEADVRAALDGVSRVYVLIQNTAAETVVGGQRQAVCSLIELLGCSFFELPMVSTVHCEIGQAVEADYRVLHDRSTSVPTNVRFYSGVSGQPYRPERDLVTAAITAHATRTIRFPAAIQRAYADGFRVFLEMGPGGSCTRLISQILDDRPHLAAAVCVPNRDPLRLVLDVVGRLIVCRLPVNLELLYGHTRGASGSHANREWLLRPEREIALDLGARRLDELPRPSRRENAARPANASSGIPGPAAPASWQGSLMENRVGLAITALHHAISATADAHQAFLAVADEYGRLIGSQLSYQHHLLETLAKDSRSEVGATADYAREDNLHQAPNPAREVPRVFNRTACLEFARGSIASVLGPDFGSIDCHPTRVRLPDEPLMLVDRILAVEGQPRSLGSGRVVTEHDVVEGDWYLEAERTPPSIAIESGQADLFLAAFLGIDFVTEGRAVYRLLDAAVTFHRGLPGPGEVIRYDIRINRFFRQGDTHLFRFEFDATVSGERLLTMRDGCAGFFSEAELAAGEGIIARPPSSLARAQEATSAWTKLFSMPPLALDDRQVNSLRQGDLAQAFGPPFDGVDVNNPLTLPEGRMTLVHRVKLLDPEGGQYGIGLIRAEADIHPSDWFMVCHFTDDYVMPGTLMYEACLHTLRIFMMRLGWIGRSANSFFEPVPEVTSRLRCRGQVITATRKVEYEVSIKRLGYAPGAFAIADAIMYADGKPIVEVSDLSLRLSGTSEEELKRFWNGHRQPAETPLASAPEVSSGRGESLGTRPKPLFDKTQILAFAEGKPSEAFGDRYRPFDDGRFIARLPRPPYLFLDRIVKAGGDPWSVADGTWARAEYDIPPDAWYFEANRQHDLPYAALLEVALQACGWVAAYMGSALASDRPLKFRNLGGTARQHCAVGRQSGTLTSEARCTKVTKSAGMIIQHYEFSIRCLGTLVFSGGTYFGFFHPEALEEQSGIRGGAPYKINGERADGIRAFPMPDRSPLPSKQWRMVERIDALLAQGGSSGLGLISGSAEVDPEAWFFAAHFLGDPVWPGSLGLESLLQLLKVFAVVLWDDGAEVAFESPSLQQTHSWVYRGQVLPSNRQVTTQATITARDNEGRWLKADGCLLVDGKVIYQMNEFGLRLKKSGAPTGEA